MHELVHHQFCCADFMLFGCGLSEHSVRIMPGFFYFFIYIDVYIDVYVYIYIYIYTRIYIRMYICMWLK